ncbi:protein JINGUBANG-like [Rutidosis leptorrhynchoides]|uniref:protein JINGUBANG-like n=1 Tax=Rutidosis leptorrhynchoides TaxID=125765 RepID=UPI003A9A61DC
MNPRQSINSTARISNSSSSDTSTDADETPAKPHRFIHLPPSYSSFCHRSISIVTGHTESVSCMALCGEFIISGSLGKEIMVWQQPDLRLFTTFGHGSGSVKSLVTLGTKIFTAHQDSKIRVWRVSRNLENIFKLVDTLPTKKDYLVKFMNHSNYIPIRRHHKRLWIEHTDTISCLTVHNNLIYSGSWDRTIKIWRVSDYKCLESIKAHDDAINALIASKGTVFSASADGKIKAWGKKEPKGSHFLNGVLDGHKDVSINSVVVSGDGSVVLGGGSDGFVMGWSIVDSWKMMFEVEAHKMSIMCMCMKGEILCTGSTDKSIGVWKREVNGLTKIGVMMGHEGPIKCLQVSPSSIGGGFLVYSGSLDKSIRVWWVPNVSKLAQDDNSEITQSITPTVLF